MGLFETIAITDLKFRLVAGPATVIFGFSMIGGVALFGEDPGLMIGAIIGVLLAIITAYSIIKILP